GSDETGSDETGSAETGKAPDTSEPLAARRATVDSDVSTEPGAPQTGDRLGGESGLRYEILEEIGSGAMGRGFRAQDLLLERRVAIKFLRYGDERKRDDLRQLFRLEALSTARLDHQNIVRVFDMGSWLGVPYLVMELLEGESLLAVLRKGR